MKKLLLPLFLLAVSCFASAQTLVISSTVEREVEKDELTVRFFVEKSGRSVEDLNRFILGEIQKGQSSVGKLAKFSTKGITTYPVYNPKGKTDGWTVRAAVEIKGPNKDQIARAIENLSGFMMIESLNFGVSEELLQSTKRDLIKTVSTEFRDKAQRAATALGYKSASISEISLDADIPHHVENMNKRIFAMESRSAVQSADMASAVTQSGGTEIIRSTMQGSVKLER